MKADMIVFSGTSHPDLGQRIANHMGKPLGRSETIKFSNENIMVRLQDNVREKDVFVVQTSSSPVNDNLVELLILIDALKYASAARITAVLPYYPYCRSDKKDEPRISVAARLVADLLQTAGADRVLGMNLHSPQIMGFFRIPMDQLLAAPIFFEYFNNVLFKQEAKEDWVLVFGDAGAAKAFAYYADELRMPVAIMDKARMDHSEKPVVRQVIGDVKGRNCLIVDDEITTGGTLVEAAHKLLEVGARKVVAAAVHPVFSGNAVQKLVNSPIERIIVGNTVPVAAKIAGHEERFEVLDLSSLFARAIGCIHDGTSMSDLFPPSVRRKA
jgi:ribose-phosphate pyrophosphokinase